MALFTNWDLLYMFIQINISLYIPVRFSKKSYKAFLRKNDPYKINNQNVTDYTSSMFKCTLALAARIK